MRTLARQCFAIEQTRLRYSGENAILDKCQILKNIKQNNLINNHYTGNITRKNIDSIIEYDGYYIISAIRNKDINT